MARPAPEAVRRTFRLGREVRSMRVVAGAWSNRVYRLSTDTGDYAVKQLLNPWQDPRWSDWLDEAWRFELTALRAGIEMPEPIPNPDDGRWLAWVAAAQPVRPRDAVEGLVPVRVHRWMAGRRPAAGAVSRAVAVWAGGVLARLHGLRIQPADRSLFPSPDTVTADRWADLVELSRRFRAPWAEQVAAVADTVRAMADLAREAPQRPEVMSHGDIDQKNLILTPDGPVLCDWDVAAPLVPVRELADVALSLADWNRFDIARTVLRAYREAGGDEDTVQPPDLGPQLMAGLDWIAFNIERALGIRPAAPQEVALGNHLVPDLLHRLPHQLTITQKVTTLLTA